MSTPPVSSAEVRLTSPLSSEQEMFELQMLALSSPLECELPIEKAIQHYRTVGDGARLAATLSIKSGLQLHRGQAEGAIDTAHLAVRLSEGMGKGAGHIDALGALAVALSFSGASKQALKMLEQAQCLANKDADNGWLLFRVGLVLMQLAQFKEAISTFNRSASLMQADPRAPYIWLWCANAHLEISQVREAKLNLNKALTCADSHRFEAYLPHITACRITIAAKEKQFTSALSLLKSHEQLLARIPLQLMATKLSCAQLMIELEKFNDARSMLEDIDPYSKTLGLKNRCHYLKNLHRLTSEGITDLSRDTVDALYEEAEIELQNNERSTQIRATRIALELLEAKLQHARSAEEIQVLKYEIEVISGQQDVNQAKQGPAGIDRSSHQDHDRASATGSSEANIATKLSLSTKGFQVLYQPIILIGGEIIGLEAYVRQRADTGEIKLPGEFLQEYKRNSDCVLLGHWIMNEVIAASIAIREQVPSGIPIYVNLFDKQLQTKGMACELQRQLTAAHTKPNAVGMEIPEWAVSSTSSTVQENIAELKEAGTPVSVGNFGLNDGCRHVDLIKLHPSMIKIDRSLNNLYKEAQRVNAITKYINALSSCTTLVVQEGVETEEECTNVIKLGITSYQGFHFSPSTTLGQILQMCPAIQSER